MTALYIIARKIYQKILALMHEYILEVVFVLAGIILINLVKTVPYINLLLIRPDVEFFLVFLLIIFVFFPKLKHVFFFILVSVFLLFLFFSLLQSKFLAEQMGNVLYAFLVIGYIRFLILLKKNK